jgi:oligopeptidase B
MKAPQAKKIEKILEIHGDTRTDNYFWLNERKTLKSSNIIEEENAYEEFIMKDTEALQEELFEEMKARYKKDDESLPYIFNEYWYIVRYEEGKEYPIFTRKYKSLDNPEEIILDVNILAEGENFFEVGSVAVSPNNELASFSSDNVGRRIYSLKFQEFKNRRNSFG